jgi:CIC family chloride channel protein
MTLDSVIERDYPIINKDMELSDLVHALSNSHREVLPVVDKAGALVGEIVLKEIRHIVFRTELYHHFKVAQLMTPPPTKLRLGDPMEDIMKAFETYNSESLPVMDEEGHLYGYISRVHLYSQYRQMVADLSND